MTYSRIRRHLVVEYCLDITVEKARSSSPTENSSQYEDWRELLFSVILQLVFLSHEKRCQLDHFFQRSSRFQKLTNSRKLCWPLVDGKKQYISLCENYEPKVYELYNEWMYPTCSYFSVFQMFWIVSSLLLAALTVDGEMLIKDTEHLLHGPFLISATTEIMCNKILNL